MPFVIEREGKYYNTNNMEGRSADIPYFSEHTAKIFLRLAEAEGAKREILISHGPNLQIREVY